MTQIAAHRFIERARCDAALRARIAALGPEPEIADLVRLARSDGLELSEQDLRAAFRHDWALRWIAGTGTRSTPLPEN